MADEIRNGCDGHCERCSANQRSYCSAQLAYYNMQEIAAIRADMARDKQETELTLVGADGRVKTPLKSEEEEKEE